MDPEEEGKKPDEVQTFELLCFMSSPARFAADLLNGDVESHTRPRKAESWPTTTVVSQRPEVLVKTNISTSAAARWQIRQYFHFIQRSQDKYTFYYICD